MQSQLDNLYIHKIIKFRSQTRHQNTAPAQPLESVRIPTNTTTQSKLLSCRRVLHMQGTLVQVHGHSLGSNWTLGQLSFWNVGHALEIVVTGIAEVGGTETEEHGHRATVATLVLQIVRAMFWAHLGLADITAAPTDQLLMVKRVSSSSLNITPGLTPKVSLPTLKTDVVSISLHGKSCRVIVPAGSFTYNSLAFR